MSISKYIVTEEDPEGEVKYLLTTINESRAKSFARERRIKNKELSLDRKVYIEVW